MLVDNLVFHVVQGSSEKVSMRTVILLDCLLWCGIDNSINT